MDGDRLDPLPGGRLRRLETAVRGVTASTPELLEYRIWQGVDDPTLVLILERWESRDAVEAVINDPALEEAMAEHGVDTSSLTLDFLDEVVSRSREPNAADK